MNPPKLYTRPSIDIFNYLKGIRLVLLKPWSIEVEELGGNCKER